MQEKLQSTFIIRMEMTQAKMKSSDNEGTKINVEQKKQKKSKYFHDNCIQITAWLLLTLGLCIIVSTFYLAITQRDADDIFDIDRSDVDRNFNSDYQYYTNEEDMNANFVTRIIDSKITKLKNMTGKGCELKFCKMICIDASNILTVLFKSMILSNCTSLDTLIIYKQNFQRGILRNNWLFPERTIKELAIVSSNITIIHNAAFNTPMFSTTFSLYLRNLNLKKIEGGALLGLHSLKYLMIDTKINFLDRAFFQPVQTTLVYLKLHAEITILEDENIFGISQMEKLEHLDLSGNNFKGLITRKTFESTPNLKYLIMARNKVTGISPDAFTHLNGKLILLDLSNNLLTKLSYKVLAPLLKSTERTFVNLSMNKWICNCNIRSLLRAYSEYRSQFMIALYCRAPHVLYGKFLDEIDLENQNCDDTATTIIEAVKSEEIETATETETEIEFEFEPTTSLTTYANKTQLNYENFTDNKNIVETRNIHLRCWSMYNAESNSVNYRTDSKSMELLPYNQLRSLNSITNKPLRYLNLDEDDDDDDDEENSNNNENTSDSDINPISAYVDYFDFECPEYTFELQLYKNNSVKITVPSYSVERCRIHFIWFDEDTGPYNHDKTACLSYEKPFVVTEPLSPNKTYTFCYVYCDYSPISPFNCLPLHVPVEKETDEDIWIPQDQKPFTIGILCLIFLISTFTGAAIAYFGIKAYPDLLEGSKNVLVVKKSDKTCYVSTISEADYNKRSSSSAVQKNILGNSNSLSTISEASTNPSNLTSLSKANSSSTYFENALPTVAFVDDEYETPKPINNSDLTYETRCIPNTYVATSPTRSPPPLPKRNSRIFNENIY